MSRNDTLFGVGLYTPADAEVLIGVPAQKISRWLKGHIAGGKSYERLWKPQVDLDDGSLHLGFRDLMEIRTANAFMAAGVSAVTIRKAIQEAQRLVGDERPLSTTKFKSDGHSVFLEVVEDDGDVRLLDLFKRQYAFKKIIEQSLIDVDFDGEAPHRWWPATRAGGVVIDPERSFGQPIDDVSGVPTRVLAQAYQAEGDYERAARVWVVPVESIKRSVEFESELRGRAA